MSILPLNSNAESDFPREDDGFDSGEPLDSNSTPIDSYDYRTGWGRVNHPVSESYENFDTLARAGFSTCLKLGAEFVFEVTVYASQAQGFLIDIGGCDTYYPVWTPDLPSLLGLLTYLSPLLQTGLFTAFVEDLAGLRQLMVEEGGPLFEAQQTEWRRERRRLEKLEAKRRTA